MNDVNNIFKIDREHMMLSYIAPDYPGNCWSKAKHRSVYPHDGLFYRVMNRLSALGFNAGKDPEFMERYKIISHDHWYGRKGSLEFKAEKFRAGFRISFFQNVVHENSHGGYYDFDKWNKVPYIIRLQFLWTIEQISLFILSEGIQDYSAPELKSAEDQIKWRFVQCWHHTQTDMDGWTLTDLDGSMGDTWNGGDSRNNLDRDGKMLHNGDIKYVRDRNGYLRRCRVYYDINMNWCCLLSKYEWVIRPCWEIFDLQEADARCRVKPGRPPKAYTEKINMLHSMSTAQLERELWRRRRASL